MNRFAMGVVICPTVIVLAVAIVRSSTVAAQPSTTDTPRAPSIVKLDEGLVVEPLNVKWLVGTWQLAHDTARRVTIKKGDAGAYLLTPEPAAAGEEIQLTVFKLECFRLVQMRSKAPKQLAKVTYALLSGHSGRLSLDVLPAIFPDGWRDKNLIGAVDAKDAEEVPVGKRGASLVWLVGKLDETGTLMHQDMTYFRSEE